MIQLWLYPSSIASLRLAASFLWLVGLRVGGRAM